MDFIFQTTCTSYNNILFRPPKPMCPGYIFRSNLKQKKKNKIQKIISFNQRWIRIVRRAYNNGLSPNGCRKKKPLFFRPLPLPCKYSYIF